jgi:hypothetical protein
MWSSSSFRHRPPWTSWLISSPPHTSLASQYSATPSSRRNSRRHPLLPLRSLSTPELSAHEATALLGEPEYREVDDCILHHAVRHHQAKGGKHRHRQGGCVGLGLCRRRRHVDNIGVGAEPRPAKSSSMCGARESRRRCCATSWGRR